MPSSSRGSQPRTKTPLSYYRSAGKPGAGGSPFQVKKQAPASTILSKTTDFLIVAAVLLGVIYSLIVSPNPKLILNSSAYHGVSAYRQTVIAELAKFKNRNKISFDESAVEKLIKNRFPEVAVTAVDLPLFSEKPTIKLNIAKPSFFLNTQLSSYVVSSAGVAVAPTTSLPNIKNLPVVIDQTGFMASAGRQVLSLQSVNFINGLLNECRRAKIPIASLTLPALAQELDLRTSDRHYFVKFYFGGDGLAQIGQFLAARHEFDKTDHQPAVYLDARVPGKVYYK